MKKLCLLLAFSFLVSCQNEKKSSRDIPKTEAPSQVLESAIDAKQTATLVGKSLESVQAACEAAGVKFRILEIDGDMRAATMDYLPERVNLRVKNGIVTEASNG